MPEAPILILLAASVAAPDAKIAQAPNGDPVVLGLSLIQRAVLTARRTGYAQVVLLGGKGRALAEVAAISDWRRLSSSFPSSRTAPLIIAPAAILAETDWLERLASTRIEPAGWAAIPERIVMLPGASAPDAVEALGEDCDAQDLAAVESRLAGRFGAPARIPSEIDPMIVETPADVRVAERRLLRTLVKDTDGFMARHVERPVSLQISRRLAQTAITPNQMSLILSWSEFAAVPFSSLSAHPCKRSARSCSLPIRSWTGATASSPG